MPTPYPILEFDPDRQALIEPGRLAEARLAPCRDAPERCVICFFRDVLDEVIAEHQARVVFDNRWEDGPHPIYAIEHAGQRIAFFHPAVGAALAAGLLEEAIASGCRQFIVCGGCGVLAQGLEVGHLVVVTAALRDEGLSYHYLSPERWVQADPRGVAALEGALRGQGLPYTRGKTWTTDAPYRETCALVAARLAEGCLTVEMEAAALMAVAQFRGVALGQVLYGGDDLSGEEWSHRGWVSRKDIRRGLFWLAVEAVGRM